MRQRLICLYAALLWSGAGSLLAHDSPEHQVQLLTSIMDSQGKSSSLLLKRASEYRVLGQVEKAISDIQEALALNPRADGAWQELCRLYLAQGKQGLALQAVNKALAGTEDEEEKASVYMLRAEVFTAQNKAPEALADMERAFKDGAPELEWYIQRGQLQGKLGKWDECLKGLQQGYEQTRSIVLEIEWIEALIDAGKPREALALIEPHLANARLKSSWLLRRARAKKALNQEFQEDLQVVLKELDQRANPRYPDLTLLADRGLACALLGRVEEARKNYEAARQLGADGWVLRRLEPLLKKTS
jgi:tetratricopeptide (TPR) repeat protein